MSGLLDVMKEFERQIPHIRIGLVGEFILDRYLNGEVERISPEAPVPILKVSQTTERLGGAGNVLKNLTGLGFKVTSFPCLGMDAHATSLSKMIETESFQWVPIIDSEIPTILKTRLVSHHHHLYRIDWDAPNGYALATKTAQNLISKVKEGFGDSKTFIFSDYGKFLFTPALLQELLSASAALKVKVFVDPKSKDFSIYKGCFAITPNTREAQAATGMTIETDQQAREAAYKIQELCGCQKVFITRGDKGMTVLDSDRDLVFHHRAKARQVFDVTGAGDTVIAILAACEAIGLSSEIAMELANLGASFVISQFGAVPCTLQDLKGQVLQSVI